MPNAFGLIGAEANAVAPGKRPLSSMSPTIILRDGQPVMTLGAAGGPTIINQVVLTIVNRLDLEQQLQEAVSGPRFHHQWSPDRVLLEEAAAADLADKLTVRGHRVERTAGIGVTQAITLTRDGTAFVGVSDPRVESSAAGL